MTEKKYPEEIYPKRKTEKTAFGIIESWHSSNLDYERAYDLGFRDGRSTEHLLNALKPLAGWSNLTEAIKAGERIEWEALDGVEAKCVHPELGTLTYKMERDAECPPEEYTGWYAENCPPVWPEAFYSAWYGRRGWSLWVKGDLPLRKLTADELAPGTCFHALYTTKGGYICNWTRAQVVQVGGEPRVICFGEGLMEVLSRYNPAEVEVVEVYGVGTFQAPEENQ